MRRLALLLAAAAVAACTAIPNRPDSPVPLARDVDLDRFMGDWYVIAHIPTFNDRGMQFVPLVRAE